MADYSQFTWVEKVTQTGPTRMNAIEAGVNDASEHHKSYANLAAFPAADAASKNWTAFAQDTGFLYCNFDGATWTRIGLDSPYFGDGSDGSLTLDGVTGASGMSKSGSTYTLTRDIYYVNLTIQAGVTLVTANRRIFCSGTFNNAGTVTNNGNAGANGVNGAAGGAAATTATLAVGAAGGNGGVGAAAGATGSAATNSHGGSGGAGGTGGAAGGAAGAASVPASSGARRAAPDLLAGVSILAGVQSGITGGGGGGGGGSVSGSNAGGGGAGGGIIVIAARVFTNSGTIQANGGAGGVAAAGTNVGGGAGGGGGALHLIYCVKTASGTLQANGGTGGAKSGTGVVGANGSNGSIIEIAV
jgi:hypothetical protein